jgi:prepilin-type N-terminal cleavage/methylation domain-containing protein
MPRPAPGPRRPTRRLRRRAGYTLIETMMALGVLTVGAMGIFALQSAVTRGNMLARQMSSATTLAERWQERLRRDALNWVTPSPVADVGALAGSQYLGQVGAGWFVPAPDAATGESASFDYYGNDTDDELLMRYCTNVRLEWLYPGRAMRADVRVWFARNQSSGTATGDAIANADLFACGQGNPAAGGGGIGDLDELATDRRVRAVYLTTILRYQTGGL